MLLQFSDLHRTHPLPRVIHKQGLLPLFVAIICQRILPFFQFRINLLEAGILLGIDAIKCAGAMYQATLALTKA